MTTPQSPNLMDLLTQHIPVTLLIDLLPADGPDSGEIYDREGGDAGWLAVASAA